ncbi:hypothetical protein BaRGS_00004406 [Batillaria attramentaria]|uniref:EF-hand domain-containing protein n=1 Tax=Batillaria attramentaria TaxID=370345 RepID=A0ABD0LYP1_9CAEN
MILQSLTVTLLCMISVNSQGGPPGVPPRQGGHVSPGHQPPPPQQQQFQQPPPPQQQQRVDPAHVNVQEGQGGHGHGKGLRFQSEIHNADHIIEHLQNVINTKPKEQMTEEELEFHYFKMHDYDNNNKLDGVEIGKALTHFHDEHEQKEPPPPGQEGQQQQEKPPAKVFSDDEIANIVDTVISDNDENGDGYVEYFEFKRKQEQQHGQKGKKPPATPDDDLSEMVDEVLAEDDRNNDGYVDYGEFIKGQRARSDDEEQEPQPYNPDMF